MKNIINGIICFSGLFIMLGFVGNDDYTMELIMSGVDIEPIPLWKTAIGSIGGLFMFGYGAFALSRNGWSD
tara:strand:+ start:225 stop:437 length:213 start_codon:yes stop_codon:yes gene_type:complete